MEWTSLACLLGRWHIVLCKLLALVYIHEFVPLRKPGKSPILFSLYTSPFLVFS